MSNIDVKKLAFFADIDSKAAESILELFHEESFTTGDTVFAEGDVGDVLYLIVDGCIRISTKIGDVEKILVTLRSGAVLVNWRPLKMIFAVRPPKPLKIARCWRLIEQHLLKCWKNIRLKVVKY